MNPRDQLMLDLFTTALEGGIGYWSTCSEYHWADHRDPDWPERDFKGFFATIHEMDDESDFEDWSTYTIDLDTVERGYALAIAGWRDKIAWSTDPPPIVVDEDTDWDFDAGDADAIVQLGLFGDVRYG